tara:strand:+ start:116 stop:1000 length:885 start_codon:yes stop_codon:yes gene_type:complete
VRLIPKRRRGELHPVIRHGLLLTWLLIAVFPLFWVFATSLKPPQDWSGWPVVWWPEEPTLFNYIQVWMNDLVTGAGAPMGETEVIGPWGALINTFIIAIISSTIATALGAVIAYGASRYRILTDSQVLYFLMLRMIPPFVVAAPVFLWFSALGIEDTLIGLIMLYTLITVPYAILVMKSFVDDLPHEFEQAAEILGAGRWRVIWEIVLPLMRPGLAATFLFLLILNWSEYYFALILSKTDVSTLPVHLNRFAGNSAPHGFQAALSVGATLPLLAIGLLIRKHLVRGLSFGFVRR